MNGTPIVVACALEFERARLARTLGGRVTLLRWGPGPDATDAGVRALHAQGVRRLVMAGVAGGLRDGPICPPITRIIDREAHAWIPPLLTGDEDEDGAKPGATLLGVDAPVCEADEKAALGVAHDAALVDCESHALARAASELGIEWGVVRAVSDSVRDRLPPEALAWTDAAGRTRPLRAAADIARHPSLVRDARRLAADSARAMDAVAARLDRMLTMLDGGADG